MKMETASYMPYDIPASGYAARLTPTIAQHQVPSPRASVEAPPSSLTESVSAALRVRTPLESSLSTLLSTCRSSQSRVSLVRRRYGSLAWWPGNG